MQNSIRIMRSAKVIHVDLPWHGSDESPYYLIFKELVIMMKKVSRLQHSFLSTDSAVRVGHLSFVAVKNDE